MKLISSRTAAFHGNHVLTVCLSLALMLMMATSVAGAQSTPDWQPGPDARGDYFCTGAIDSPAPGAAIANGAPVELSGWIVDMTARGWAGFDDLHVYDGTAASGRFLTQGTVGMTRPDVAAALGDAYYASAGFQATIPGGALAPGEHTLTIYAHTPDKGWWYRQVAISVAAETSALTGHPAAAILSPEYGEKVYTGDKEYTIMGYALDQAASIYQGSQGTGIDRVQVFINDMYFGDADLAYSDAQAATFGSHFANAGFRFTLKPTMLHEGNAQLEVRAHSVVTGKEVSVSTTFLVVEGSQH